MSTANAEQDNITLTTRTSSSGNTSISYTSDASAEFTINLSDFRDSIDTDEQSERNSPETLEEGHQADNQNNLQENTCSWRSANTPSRSIGGRVPTTVVVRLEFLKIHEVDSKANSFVGDILIEARWCDSSITGNVKEDFLEHEKKRADFWNPRLTVVNMDRNHHQEVWHEIEQAIDGTAVVVYKKKIQRGIFFVKFELRYFPFDIQQLPITVVSEHNAKDVMLDIKAENFYNPPSSIHEEVSREIQAFKFYSSVLVKVKKHFESASNRSATDALVSTTVNTFVQREKQRYGGRLSIGRINVLEKRHIQFTCFVARNYRVWLFNTYSLLVLISLLTFAPLVYDAKSTVPRVRTEMKLLLTCITTRLATRSMIPPVCFLTFLDFYFVYVMCMTGLLALQFCIASAVTDKGKTDLINELDIYAGGFHGMALVLFNTTYFAFIGSARRKVKAQIKGLQR